MRTASMREGPNENGLNEKGLNEKGLNERGLNRKELNMDDFNQSLALEIIIIYDYDNRWQHKRQFKICRRRIIKNIKRHFSGGCGIN